ncbi:MAG: SRPBCC family protein [Thermodesulfobacteriota bacterium]
MNADPRLLLACLAAGTGLSPSEPGWKESGSTEEFKAYHQDSEEGQTRKVLMIGVMDVPPEALFAVVTDYDRFSEFMPYVQFTKLLSTEKIDDNKSLSYVFFYLNPPMITNRFYTIELTDEKNMGGVAGVYRSRWTLAPPERRVAPDSPEIRRHVKIGFKNPVETAFNEGYWLLEPVEGGAKTKVSYYVWANPGGMIPAQIADKANAIALPKLWNAVKARVAEKFRG